MPPTSFEDACRKAKFRNNRRFLQDRVWRWLRRQTKPAHVNDAVAALGMNRKAVSNVLYSLGKRGLAQTRNRRWVAIGVSPPEDMRGTAPGTMVNLTHGSAKWKESLPKALLAARGQKAVDCLLSNINAKNVVQKGRDSTPAKSVRIPTLAELLGVKDAA